MIFMVALHKTDIASGFSFSAPLYKTEVHLILIALQSDPKFKNITKEDHIMMELQNVVEHTEEVLGLAEGPCVDVRIRYYDNAAF